MFDEILNAMKALQDAKYDLMCAESRFNYAHPDYFEIANTDLTIAQEAYKVAEARLNKLTSTGDKFPQYDILF